MRILDYLKKKKKEREQKFIESEQQYYKDIKLKAAEAEKQIIKLKEIEQLNKKILEYETLKKKNRPKSKIEKIAEGMNKFGENFEEFQKSVGDTFDGISKTSNQFLGEQKKDMFGFDKMFQEPKKKVGKNEY